MAPLHPAREETTPGADRWTPLVFGVVWVVVTAALQWSVVRFELPILLALTVAAVALGVGVVRDRVPPLGPAVSVGLLLASVVVLWVVPLFTYLRGGWYAAALAAVSATGLLCALLLGWPSSRLRGVAAGAAAVGTAAVGHAVLAAVAVLGDRAPRIDVWVVLQDAADALGRGANFYELTFPTSPGIHHFAYLPWTVVLLAPGRWLGGDVRWALAAWMLVLLTGIALLALGAHRDRREAWRLAGSVAALVVVIPGALTLVDQAWTEPLLAALLVLWAVLLQRGHPWWAVLPLALACASKQHVVLVVPLLLLWRPFGWRRVIATAGLSIALVVPWLVADAGRFVDDTVVRMVTFDAVRFANTWYLFFLNEFGVRLPFWLTGAVVAAAVGLSAWGVHRSRPGLGEVLRWMALVLLVANLVNKQSFYNQFWLSAVLVLVSLVIPARGRRAGPAIDG